MRAERVCCSSTPMRFSWVIVISTCVCVCVYVSTELCVTHKCLSIGCIVFECVRDCFTAQARETPHVILIHTYSLIRRKLSSKCQNWTPHRTYTNANLYIPKTETETCASRAKRSHVSPARGVALIEYTSTNSTASTYAETAAPLHVRPNTFLFVCDAFRNICASVRVFVFLSDVSPHKITGFF